MKKSFMQRRHEKEPDYDIEVWITGVRHGATGLVEWNVQVEGEDDPDVAAGILERAAEVLRDKLLKCYEVSRRPKQDPNRK